jgi:hypothetical protein
MLGRSFNMAEVCAKCFMEKIATPADNIKPEQLVLSDTWEICECCGNIFPVVVRVKGPWEVGE